MFTFSVCVGLKFFLHDKEWLPVSTQECPADELHVLAVVDVCPWDLVFLVMDGVSGEYILSMIIHSFSSFVRLPRGPGAAPEQTGLTVVRIVIWLGSVQRSRLQPSPSSSISDHFKFRARFDPVQTCPGAGVGT